MSQRSLFEREPGSSISSPAASHAPISLSPERAPDSLASSPASGARCSGLSGESRRLGASLRTFLRFALGGRSRWSLIWRRAAIPSCRLSWWVLGRLELRTEGTESGSSLGEWPTATAADADRASSHYAGGNSTLLGAAGAFGREWATPRASEAENRTTRVTPSQTTGDRHTRRGEYLAVQALEWPTPAAAEYGSSNNGSPRDGRREVYATAGKPSLEGCAREEWPTPTARDWKSTAASQETHERNARPLSEIVGLPEEESLNSPGSRRGSLNPEWVEALMGAPSGWTALPDETVSELWATRTRRKSRS